MIDRQEREREDRKGDDKQSQVEEECGESVEVNARGDEGDDGHR